MGLNFGYVSCVVGGRGDMISYEGRALQKAGISSHLFSLFASRIEGEHATLSGFRDMVQYKTDAAAATALAVELEGATDICRCLHGHPA